MSYILSALKKAEQERHRGDVPDVLTMQRVVTEPLSLPPERARAKPYLIGGLAVLFLSGLWFAKQFYPDNNPVTVYSGVPMQPAWPPDQAADASGEGQAGAPASLKSDAATRGTGPGTRSASPVWNPSAPARGFADDEVAFDRTDRQGSSRSPSWSHGDEILDIATLAPSMREQLPRLVLSGHLYSLAHPQARKIILNGIALKEKQYLDDDLMVSEITPDGVVLDFRGNLFSMSASQMFR